jgi:hypothetical protein
MVIITKEDVITQNTDGHYVLLFQKGAVLHTIRPEYMARDAEKYIGNPNRIKVTRMWDEEETEKEIYKQCFFVYDDKKRKYIAIPKEICEVPKIHNGYHNY